MNIRKLALRQLARSQQAGFFNADGGATASYQRWTAPTATYVICTNPRSGSWLLSEGLASTGLAGNPREWINIQEEERQRALWRMDHQSDLNLPAYFRLARAKATTSNGVSGIKLHYFQFTDLPGKLGLSGVTASQVMARLFPGARYIWLRRRDKARQAISLLMAASTNEWWIFRGMLPERPEGGTEDPTFDPWAISRLESTLERNDEGWRGFFGENGITPLTIDYEDLASDYPGTIATILEWLGIAGVGAISPPRLQRQSNARTEDWVERYAAFKAGGSLLTEKPAEGENPLSANVRQSRETIPDIWKRWIGQSKAIGTDHDEMVAVLVSNGYGRDAALNAVREAAADPYLSGSARRQQRLSKAASLLNAQAQLARLGSRAAVVECHEALSRDDFRERYYAANRPVVIRGLMSEWRAMTAWTPDYLKRVAGAYVVQVMTGRDADPRFEMNGRHRTEIRFADYVDMVFSGRVTNDYYMVPNNGFLQSPVAAPLLQDFTAFPDYLRPIGAGRACFLWFGPAGTITPLHHETSNILLAQVLGRKRYRLIPAAQWQCVYNSTGVFSDVDCERPDFEQFPKFRDATVIDVVVRPGEVMFMPVGWWHHVRALDVSMTVAFTNFVFPNFFSWEG
jgi:LPS sulfotransferase NodH